MDAPIFFTTYPHSEIPYASSHLRTLLFSLFLTSPPGVTRASVLRYDLRSAILGTLLILFVIVRQGGADGFYNGLTYTAFAPAPSYVSTSRGPTLHMGFPFTPYFLSSLWRAGLLFRSLDPTSCSLPGGRVYAGFIYFYIPVLLHNLKDSIKRPYYTRPRVFALPLFPLGFHNLPSYCYSPLGALLVSLFLAICSRPLLLFEIILSYFRRLFTYLAKVGWSAYFLLRRKYAYHPHPL